jgi:predicted  nucleic acid-binding Zn-ribbon protein
MALVQVYNPVAALSIAPRIGRLAPRFMTDVAELLSLQDTDVALDRALSRLAEIEAALGESEELVAARETAAEKATTAHDVRSQQKDLELAADTIRGKAAEIEKKLYGGSVKNPKELQDLDADLRSLKEQTRKREDELLALLVQIEEAQAERQAAESALAVVEAAWRRSQDELLAEKAEIEPEFESLRGIRHSQATEVDRRLISLYDLLRERRGGTAVARVERGMCQGCRISLPMSVLQRARTGVSVVQCVSCERILLLT